MSGKGLLSLLKVLVASAKLAALHGKEMVRPERFELPTCCSGGNRSIQLSYGRARIFTVYMGKEEAST